MGFLSSLFGLHTSAEDDLTVAREIYADRKGKELSPREVRDIELLMRMREDKLDRARGKGGTG